MSAESYFGAMQSRKDRLARCGLGPKPSVDELVDVVIELSDKLDALYDAARREEGLAPAIWSSRWSPRPRKSCSTNRYQA